MPRPRPWKRWTMSSGRSSSSPGSPSSPPTTASRWACQSFSSLSLDPPLVLFTVMKTSRRGRASRPPAAHQRPHRGQGTSPLRSPPRPDKLHTAVVASPERSSTTARCGSPAPSTPSARRRPLHHIGHRASRPPRGFPPAAVPPRVLRRRLGSRDMADEELASGRRLNASSPDRRPPAQRGGRRRPSSGRGPASR